MSTSDFQHNPSAPQTTTSPSHLPVPSIRQFASHHSVESARNLLKTVSRIPAARSSRNPPRAKTALTYERPSSAYGDPSPNETQSTVSSRGISREQTLHNIQPSAVSERQLRQPTILRSRSCITNDNGASASSIPKTRSHPTTVEHQQTRIGSERQRLANVQNQMHKMHSNISGLQQRLDRLASNGLNIHNEQPIEHPAIPDHNHIIPSPQNICQIIVTELDQLLDSDHQLFQKCLHVNQQIIGEFQRDPLPSNSCGAIAARCLKYNARLETEIGELHQNQSVRFADIVERLDRIGSNEMQVEAAQAKFEALAKRLTELMTKQAEQQRAAAKAANQQTVESRMEQEKLHAELNKLRAAAELNGVQMQKLQAELATKCAQLQTAQNQHVAQLRGKSQEIRSLSEANADLQERLRAAEEESRRFVTSSDNDDDEEAIDIDINPVSGNVTLIQQSDLRALQDELQKSRQSLDEMRRRVGVHEHLLRIRSELIVSMQSQEEIVRQQLNAVNEVAVSRAEEMKQLLAKAKETDADEQKYLQRIEELQHELNGYSTLHVQVEEQMSRLRAENEHLRKQYKLIMDVRSFEIE